MKLNIYLAADAVMYLPLYVAKEKGVFQTLLPDIETNLYPTDGDYNAILRMRQDNLSTDRSLMAIAIADPNGIKSVKNVKVIAALIDRLSFWAISRKDVDLSQDDIIQNMFSEVVYYNQNLITGHKVGKSFYDKENLSSKQIVDRLGEEFNHLDNEGSIIITPDLLKIAYHQVKGNIHINYHFAKGDRYIPSDYITTAVITSKCCLRDPYQHKLARVIEAIQKAMSIIYSSKQIAKEILLNMDCLSDGCADVDRERVAEKIIEIIYEDRIYPSDLNITNEKWCKTLSNDGPSFETYVNNDIVLEAERRIADQFGITANETFAEVIKDIKQSYECTVENLTTKCSDLHSSINALKNQLKRYEQSFIYRFSFWLKKHRLLFPMSLAMLLITIVWILNLIEGEGWANHGITYATIPAIDLFLLQMIISELKASSK